MPAPNLAPGDRSAPAARSARASAAVPHGRRAVSQPNNTAAIPATSPPLWKQLAVSLLLFLLVAEWLAPLPLLSPMTELYDIRPFLGLFGLALLLDGLRVPAGWSAPLKGALAIGMVGYLFYPVPFTSLSLSWLPELAARVLGDIEFAAQGQYELIGGETRTLLFAVGWCMMVSVIHVLLIQRQQAVWLGCMTLLYLLLMQLIFGIDTTNGVLRAFAWSGLLLALLLPDRLLRLRGLQLHAAYAWRWSAAAALVIAVCIAFGWYGWKPEGTKDHRLMNPLDSSMLERWPLSNQSASGYSRTNPAGPNGSTALAAGSITGYSSDDSILGGPIRPDNTIAFEARTSALAYWRGEARSIYTGKGWQASAAKLEPYQPQVSPPASSPASPSVLPSASQSISSVESPSTSPEASPLTSSPAEPSTSSPNRSIIRQDVMLPSPITTRLLFTGGALVKVDALLSAQEHLIPTESLRYDVASSAYMLPEFSEPAAYYRIETALPTPNPTQLSQDNGIYPSGITDQELQLPAALPERVKELARSITEAAPSTYDKAAAIAAYLQTHYRYSMSEPTIPASGEDFVDHFLYIDKAGYCDQFSTAMTVMLRAVGVPARWVKGYAPGTEQADPGTSPSTDMHAVVVRNRDAHSWVEVYFPSYGWIPFDPTPGFSNGNSPLSLTGNEAASPLATSTTVTAATLGKGITEPPKLLSGLIVLNPLSGGNAKAAATGLLSFAASHASSAAAGLAHRPWLLATAIALVICTLTLSYLARTRWMVASLGISSSIRAAGNPQLSSILLMDRLWHRVYRIYGAQAPQETIREYVARIAAVESDSNRCAALQEFSRLYELSRYAAQHRRPIARRTLRELWKRIHSSG